MPEQNPDDLRADGTPKGKGYLGVLSRPDGRVSTELSIGVGDVIPGQEVEIPTIVPTLTPEELHFLLNMPDDADIPEPIVNKAIDFARQRLKQGHPFFAEPGEQLYHIYPEFKRLDVPTSGFNDGSIRPMSAHGR